MRSSRFHLPAHLLARRSPRGRGPDASRDVPEPELGDPLREVRRPGEWGGGEGGNGRHRRGSAGSCHDPVSLLHPSGPRPAPPHALAHAPRRVSEWPAPAVASRSQPVGRPLAARAQIEVRARRGARARDEERGTRHEARGTRQRRDEECRCLPHGAVKEWCCWMRGARACRMGARHVSLRLR